MSPYRQPETRVEIVVCACGVDLGPDERRCRTCLELEAMERQLDALRSTVLWSQALGRSRR